MKKDKKLTEEEFWDIVDTLEPRRRRKNYGCMLIGNTYFYYDVDLFWSVATYPWLLNEKSYL